MATTSKIRKDIEHILNQIKNESDGDSSHLAESYSNIKANLQQILDTAESHSSTPLVTLAVSALKLYIDIAHDKQQQHPPAALSIKTPTLPKSDPQMCSMVLSSSRHRDHWDGMSAQDVEISAFGRHTLVMAVRTDEVIEWHYSLDKSRKDNSTDDEFQVSYWKKDTRGYRIPSSQLLSQWTDSSSTSAALPITFNGRFKTYSSGMLKLEWRNTRLSRAKKLNYHIGSQAIFQDAQATTTGSPVRRYSSSETSTAALPPCSTDEGFHLGYLKHEASDDRSVFHEKAVQPASRKRAPRSLSSSVDDLTILSPPSSVDGIKFTDDTEYKIL